jgi:hypothetical protein
MRQGARVHASEPPGSLGFGACEPTRGERRGLAEQASASEMVRQACRTASDVDYYSPYQAFGVWSEKTLNSKEISTDSLEDDFRRFWDILTNSDEFRSAYRRRLIATRGSFWIV